MLASNSTFLRTYPVPWPVFSTRNYTKDAEGWWVPSKKNRNRKNKKML